MELACKASIDVRAKQRVEGMRDLSVFALAANGAVLRQEVFFNHIGKQFRIGPVGHAQQIVEALRRLPCSSAKFFCAIVTVGDNMSPLY